MPPSRSRKYQERLSLALLIDSLGIDMPPCSYCEKNSRRCVVSEGHSARCSECARRGQKCDVEGPSQGDLASVLREQDRLDAEEEATTAKLLRLQQQKKFLRARAHKMLTRGLKTLDELDSVEERERQEAQALEVAASLSGPLSAEELSTYDPNLLLEEWDAVGGTAQEIPSNS